jgi:hypothetical protein
MPRQSRRPPWRLTSFNYWGFASVRPQSADEARTFSSVWLREQGHEICWSQNGACIWRFATISTLTGSGVKMQMLSGSFEDCRKVHVGHSNRWTARSTPMVD